MVYVNVIKRFINIIPMQKSITQNDQAVVTYRFRIDRHYERLDLGEYGWEWSIAWKNSLDVPDVILLDATADEEKVYVDWTPKWPETAADGLFEFQIRAKRDDPETGELLKWNSQTAHLDFNSSVGLGRVDRGILDEYLDKFMQLCSTATIDAEQRRALAAELALSQNIQNLDESIAAQIELINQYLERLDNDLSNFDAKQISHYEAAEEDFGKVSAQDTLDRALAKLQWQIDHVSVGGILPVSQGGTGASSFESGVMFSDGSTLPLRTVNGLNGEVLSKVNGHFAFRRLSTEDLSDNTTLLQFRELDDVEIDISRFIG